MKLKTKMMLILIVTVVLAMAGSSIFFFQQYKSAFRDSVYRSVDAVAKNNVKSLANYLNWQQTLAQHIGAMLPVEAVENKDYYSIEEYLADHYNGFPFFNAGIFFLDAQGILKAAYPPHPELFDDDYSYRQYFKQTLIEKNGIIGKPYRSTRSGMAVLTFTAYIKSSSGKFLGIIGCSTSLATDEVLSELRHRKLGKTGYSYVFDEDRLMILHPKDGRMLTSDVPIGANKMFDAATKGFAGTVETTNSKGVKMLVSFRPVAKSNWIVASQITADEAFAPLMDSQKIYFVFVFIASLLAATVGLFFVHRSIRDLDTLVIMTSNLTVPDRDNPKIDITAETEKLKTLYGHPEFGLLSDTISKLYSQLGHSLTETQQMAEELGYAYQQLKATQSQILHQEKMASVGQLAAGVAHEINNPMGFITSNLSTLKRYQTKLIEYLSQLETWLGEQASSDVLELQQQLKKKQKIAYILEDIEDLIEESSDGAIRVREIVQNLKSFSRVDQTDFTAADINECLESTIAIATNEIKYKATLVKEYGELPLLSCCPQQLNQVFLNILVNAAQAIDKNGEIKIRTWCEDDSVMISISDNGSGIPVELQQKIFEPFFTTKAVGEGTGLGMSISYEIIQKHHGQITVTSEVDLGTTFTITLPLGQENAE